jgi:hypothetical protein
MQTDLSEHARKHDSPIRTNRELEANLRDLSFEPEKQNPQRTSTELGIQRDPIEQSRKHDSSIVVRRGTESNTNVSIVMFDSQDFGKTSTEPGI